MSIPPAATTQTSEEVRSQQPYGASGRDIAGDQDLSIAARTLLWCAGATETELFEGLKTEQTRYVSLGLAVCIPALVGFVGGALAIYVVSKNVAAAIVGALVWAAVVFIIDRGLVSTLRLTKPPTPTDGFWQRARFSAGQWIRQMPLLVFRFVVALLIGAIVSHSLVLAIFAPEVEEHLGATERTKVAAARTAEAEVIADEISRLVSASARLFILIEDRRDERAALDIALRDEIGGVGVTGDKGDGDTAKSLRVAIQSKIEDIEAAEGRLANINEDLISLRNEARLAGDTAAAQVRSEHARGYMARARALEALASSSDELNRDRITLLLFFISLEVLPLGLKLSVLGGPYSEQVAFREWVASETVQVSYLSHSEPRRMKVNQRKVDLMDAA